MKKMSQTDAIFHRQLGQFAKRPDGVKLDMFQIAAARNFALNGNLDSLSKLLGGADPRELYKAKYFIGPYFDIVTSADDERVRHDLKNKRPPYGARPPGGLRVHGPGPRA